MKKLTRTLLLLLTAVSLCLATFPTIPLSDDTPIETAQSKE